MLIGGAGLLDLRLMGLFRGLAIRHVKALMPWAIGGFLINAVTGALFLIMQPHLYLSSGRLVGESGLPRYRRRERVVLRDTAGGPGAGDAPGRRHVEAR